MRRLWKQKMTKIKMNTKTISDYLKQNNLQKTSLFHFDGQIQK